MSRRHSAGAAAEAFDQMVGGALVSRQGFNFEGAWPEAMQTREIAILKECRTLDEQGVAEMQQALDEAQEQ